MDVLEISRGIQGIGASAMVPLSLAIISATFTGKQRGTAIVGGHQWFETAAFLHCKMRFYSVKSKDLYF